MADPTVDDPPAPLGFRTLSRLGLLIAVAGALIQLLLGVYYLAMAHSPSPHELPVGIVGTAEQQAQLRDRLEANDDFVVEEYDDAAALTQAIERREAYGGVVFDGDSPTLHIASAASPAVANLFRNQFTAAYQDQVDQQVAALRDAGQPVPAEQVAALTAAPPVVDVVPLPEEDSAGSSLGFVIQALCLGGSIASLALGRLRSRTERSTLRGVGHAGLLVVYALASAGVALLAMRLFGVGDGADHLTLFGGLALISLAITASTAASVAVFGALGSLIGALYFTLGLIISGSSIAPEMLPPLGRTIGQLLPPGAGATVARDALYFPDASTSGPFVVLGAFAAIGLLVVLVVNASANRTRFPRLLGRGEADAEPSATASRGA
ncbi:ABC transporter permease [Nocardioides caeni]|uniref:ABC transporter permease n=1 Tax=Nocardioides caeni TaxID=574700 RepID=UPI0013052F31|nr:ABC transporter permease [Nocardioides caeni]